MVDRVRERPIEQQTFRIEEDFHKVVEELRHGNIHEVLAKAKIPKVELQKFFVNQWKQWQSQIVQNYETYAAQGIVPEPVLAEFHLTNPQNILKQGESTMLLDGLMNTSKAMTVKSTETETGGTEGDTAPTDQPAAEGPMSQSELQQTAEGTLDEWDVFMGDMWSQVLDAQMVKDYEARMSEIKQEVDRIIAMAKSGQIGPEFVLLALAKVNQAKNGVLFAWMGKKASGFNEQMNRASEELYSMKPTDPNYTAALTRTQSVTRDSSYQLNIVTSDMQKVMQDVSSVMENVHSMMNAINQTRREIISRVGAR